MEKNKRLFYLGFLIIILLAMGLALLRISSSLANRGYTPTVSGNSEGTDPRSIADLKAQEILGISPQESSLNKDQKRALAVQRYVRRPELAVSARNHPSREEPSIGKNHYYSSLPSVSTGSSFSTGNTYRPKGLSAANYVKYTSSDGGASNSEAFSQQPGVYRPTVEEAIRSERERSFTPFMAAVPKEQKERLENQLKGLSDGINRAVAKALLPKSKKDANIEKYLQRHASPQMVAAGPFAPVLQQVAAQKANVVHSMGQAFGSKAAQTASKVMDSFQNEMASAVTAPGQTPQQIAQKVQQVSQKYEKQLQQVADESGFEKFEQERIEKDNLLKEALAKQYGAEIAAQAGEKIDEFREKDMMLARQGLPAEEYYNQQMKNQRDRRKALEEVITKNGRSTQSLMNVEDKLEAHEVEQRLKDEEEGKTLGRSYRASKDELAAIDNSLVEERKEKLQMAGQIYGEDGARKVDELYQRYYDAYMKIWSDPDSSKTSKQHAAMKLRQDVNKQLEQIQNDPKMQEMRLNNQVESSLQQMMNDPGVQRASPEQKAALQEKARPILREMYEEVNKVVASNLPDAEKQKQLERIQAQAQQKLAEQ